MMPLARDSYDSFSSMLPMFGNCNWLFWDCIEERSISSGSKSLSLIFRSYLTVSSSTFLSYDVDYIRSLLLFSKSISLIDEESPESISKMPLYLFTAVFVISTLNLSIDLFFGAINETFWESLLGSFVILFSRIMVLGFSRIIFRSLTCFTIVSLILQS